MHAAKEITLLGMLLAPDPTINHPGAGCVATILGILLVSTLGEDTLGSDGFSFRWLLVAGATDWTAGEFYFFFICNVFENTADSFQIMLLLIS